MRADTLSTGLAFALLTGSGVQAAAGYKLVDNFDASNFFTTGFNFFNQTDPTKGSVKYLTLPQAAKAQIAGFIPADQAHRVYLGVDTSPNPASGNRGAIRLESKKFYKHGLFAADIAHMPGGTCASWPAFWMVGKKWPEDGEIDILEGVNLQTGNAMTLHSSAGCAMKNATGQQTDKPYTGTMVHSDCDVKSPTQPENVGCSIQDARPESYGEPFNAAGGGVYAVEWTSQVIRMWFFARTKIPADLNGGSATPDPSKWGPPTAAFEASETCDLDARFQAMQIVINTTLCGSWAGTAQEWAKNPECAKQAPTCEDFVKNNPQAFDEAYWSINSIRTFSNEGAAAGAQAKDL